MIHDGDRMKRINHCAKTLKGAHMHAETPFILDSSHPLSKLSGKQIHRLGTGMYNVEVCQEERKKKLIDTF